MNTRSNGASASTSGSICSAAPTWMCAREPTPALWNESEATLACFSEYSNVCNTPCTPIPRSRHTPLYPPNVPISTALSAPMARAITSRCNPSNRPTAMGGSPSRTLRSRISRRTASSGRNTSSAQRARAGSPWPNPLFCGELGMARTVLRSPADVCRALQSAYPRRHGRSLGHLVLGGCFDLPGEPQVAISDSALVVAEGRDRDFVELDEDVRMVIGAVGQLAHRARERHRRLEAFEIERLLQRVVLPLPSRQLREGGLDLGVGR